MIQLHRLEGFYRVARAGGYARAVREFPYPISEPAVHQQVRKLELELGQRLLRRIAKDRMALTAAGQHLYDFCAPFFEQLPRIEREVAGGHLAGTLRVDAGPQEIRHLLPALIRALKKRHPGARVDLNEIVEPNAARLRSGEADLVIEHWPEPPADVAQKRIGTVYAIWIVPAAFAPGRRVRRERLHELPFVGFPPASRQHALQLRGLKLHELRPQELFTASTVDAIVGFVQAGLGYSIVPWPAPTGPKLRGIVAERLRLPVAEFSITISWLARAEQHPLLAAALALV
jgi:DNA-binding transcriptional LysR family regulator